MPRCEDLIPDSLAPYAGPLEGIVLTNYATEALRVRCN